MRLQNQRFFFFQANNLSSKPIGGRVIWKAGDDVYFPTKKWCFFGRGALPKWIFELGCLYHLSGCIRRYLRSPSHEVWPFGKGINSGDKNSPWLLTTYLNGMILQAPSFFSAAGKGVVPQRIKSKLPIQRGRCFFSSTPTYEPKDKPGKLVSRQSSTCLWNQLKTHHFPSYSIASCILKTQLDHMLISSISSRKFWT